MKDKIGVEAVRLTASKVITMGISLATSMLLARFRTFEEYGTYSQMLLIINLATTLLMMGLPNSINYFLGRAESPEERKKFLSIYYTLSTLLSFIIGVVLVLAIPLIVGYFHNPLIKSFFYFLALFPWTNIIGTSIENVLVVYSKTKFLMGFRLLHSAVTLGVIVVVQLLNYGFTTFMISYVAENCGFAIAVYIIVSKCAGGIRPSFDLSIIKQVLIFSIPIGLASVVGTLNTEIDKLLIGYLMDTEQMAIYSNAARELPIAFVSTSITAVLLPRLSRMIKLERNRDAIKLWGYAVDLAFIILSCVIFGIFTYAEDAMSFLYSAKYLPGVNVFRVYTLNLVLRVTYFGIILNASGNTKKILLCSICSLVLNSILNPLFYWIFGMIGPAIATFIAILAILLLQLKMTAKIMRVRFREIFPWMSLLKTFVVNLLFMGVFWLLKYFIPLDSLIGSVAESIILGVLWIGLYFLLMRKKITVTWRALNQGGE